MRSHAIKFPCAPHLGQLIVCSLWLDIVHKLKVYFMDCLVVWLVFVIHEIAIVLIRLFKCENQGIIELIFLDSVAV